MEGRGTSETMDGNEARLPYFLIKPESSPAEPELGQEMANTRQASIEVSSSGQRFYPVTAWQSVPQVNGESPGIVKQGSRYQDDLEPFLKKSAPAVLM